MRQSDTSPLAWPSGGESAPEEAELLSAKMTALFGQVGTPDGFEEMLHLEAPCEGIRDGDGLRNFLQSYQSRNLGPIELPSIAKAHYLSSRGHFRELISLDAQIGAMPIAPALASASRRTGRIQIERLRPLRDERTVQRYLAAIETGQACGWHTVVYGLSIAVYAWPLRNALLMYARETIAGLARAAARRSAVPAPICQEVLQSILPQLPRVVEQTLSDDHDWGRPSAVAGH